MADRLMLDAGIGLSVLCCLFVPRHFTKLIGLLLVLFLVGIG
jgi:hypothetical protein